MNIRSLIIGTNQEICEYIYGLGYIDDDEKLEHQIEALKLYNPNIYTVKNKDTGERIRFFAFVRADETDKSFEEGTWI